MVKESINLFLVLIYVLPVPKKVWYIQLLNRHIPSQWHCVCLKHIWMCVFFLYFVKIFTFLPKRSEILLRQCRTHSSSLLEHTACVCLLPLFSAELTGHLPPQLLVHSSFCALPLPHALRVFILTLSKTPAHNILFSVLSAIKTEATTEKKTTLKHVAHTVQCLALGSSV